MPAGRGLRKRRTEAQWNEVLGRLSISGLSSREFCRREGLALSSLQRWRARLSPSSPVGGFVEMNVAPGGARVQEAWSVELTLPNGMSLRLQG